MKNLRKLSYQTGHWHGEYPELRLAGKYLTDKYGLRVGDHVKVRYLKKSIVITT